MASNIFSTIYSVIEHQATRNGGATAIGAPERLPLSYCSLLTARITTVETLNSLGLGRNDRVAIVLPSGPEMAVALLGVAAGFTSAPLNPAYCADEFDFYL